MLLSIDDLVALLRDSVNIQEGDLVDPNLVSMTDEDILRYIKLGVTRIYPDLEDIEDLPSDCSEYAIILLAKIELYLKLAVTKVDKVDMGADNNNYLKNDQRFSHYMKLVEEAREEYESWLDNEGNGKVETYDILLEKYSHTKRNYEKQPVPKVTLKISNVTKDSLDLDWSAVLNNFGKFMVYINTSTVVDLHNSDESTVTSCISENSKLIRQTFDIRNCHKSIEGLEPNTEYHIAVISQCRNGVWGYKEKVVTTLEEVIEEEIDL